MTEAHKVLEGWLREGRPEPQPAELREHLDGCPTCRAALAELEEERAWFGGDEQVDADRVAAIRFELQTAAREARRVTGSHPVAPRRRLWVFGLAAAIVIAAMGGTLLVQRSGQLEEIEARPVPSAFENQVQPEVRLGEASQRDPTPPPQNRAVRPTAPEEPLVDQPEPLPAEAQPTQVAREVPRVRRRARPADRDQPTARSKLDEGFHAAWKLFTAGRYDAASFAFDELLGGDTGPRRADVLYWSGRAHLRAGRRAKGLERLNELLRAYPRAWHAADAKEILEHDARKTRGATGQESP